MVQTLTVEEITLSDAARRLAKLFNRDFSYRDVSTLCRMMGIRPSDGPGNRKLVTAAQFGRMIEQLEAMRDAALV
jgi:hypothetical protein